jgi:hypothetical protein
MRRSAVSSGEIILLSNTLSRPALVSEAETDRPLCHHLRPYRILRCGFCDAQSTPSSNRGDGDPWRRRSVAGDQGQSPTRDRASYLWMLNKHIPKKVKAGLAVIGGNSVPETHDLSPYLSAIPFRLTTPQLVGFALGVTPSRFRSVPV